MIDKALGLGHVDAVMLDIEDGVPRQEKQTARDLIGKTLAQVKPGGRGPVRFVRINAIGHDDMHADLKHVIQPELDGLVLPKVETPDQVRAVDALLREREPYANLPAGTIALLVAIESPRGLRNVYEIALASPRVAGLMFGAEDLGRALGLPLRREGEARDMLFHRSMLVTAAAAANVQPVDGVWPDIQDMEGLRRFAIQSRRLGFSGMSLIHPGQVDTINEVFSPTEDEVAYCRQVIEAFDAAVARGDGSIAFGGQLIDLPIVERAKRTVALAEKANPVKGRRA
jgi:citrate lyase subunit beta/citryl-CoA lyase